MSNDRTYTEEELANEVPLVEDEPDLMKRVQCAGCGTREGVKTLALKTTYGGSRNGRQILPLCEMCSIDFGMQLFHIWNPKAGVA